jgi:hypothetical protein
VQRLVTANLTEERAVDGTVSNVRGRRTGEFVAKVVVAKVVVAKVVVAKVVVD